MICFSYLAENVCWKPRLRSSGHVCSVNGSLLLAKIPAAALGDLCMVERRSLPALRAQIVGFQEDLCSLAPFDIPEGISPGARIHGSGAPPTINCNSDLRGKVIDALGTDLRPVKTGRNPDREISLPFDCAPPRALERKIISTQFRTGIRLIDELCPIGYGQRMGVFAPAGVGKSTLLGMIASQSQVDVSVIALVGERGREVQEFLQNCMGPAGLARSVVVVATSDESPLRRLLAPKTATAIAEYYRDRGMHVLLLVDSLTRTARAIRDVELSAGGIPIRQGYTAGVYSELPKLLERAGTGAQGSITGLYTFLTAVEGESDALADEAKSILDGHLVLDAQLAQQGLRPAIAPLTSISRLTERFLSSGQQTDLTTVLTMLSRLKRDRDIVLLGGRADPELRAALELEAEFRAAFTQPPQAPLPPAALSATNVLADKFRALRSRYEQEQS